MLPSVALQRLWRAPSVRQVDQKLDRLIASVNDRIDGVDQSLSLKIDRLDDKMSRQFLWILGVQVAVLIAVVGALARG